VAALSLGCAGYLAIGHGFLPVPRGASGGSSSATDASTAAANTVFFALEPFMVTLPRTDPVRQLRLELQLELPQSGEAAVRAATPRLQATMNTYLMAIDLSDIEDPNAMLRVRMQLLRRLQVAVGEGLIQDLLITQFLIS
jgi:flagellar FliL protein